MEITPERDDDEPPLDTNNIETEKSTKSLTDLHSAEGVLFGSDAGGRTKIRRAAAIDGDVKRRLLQQDEEEDEFNDFGGDNREVNRSFGRLTIDQRGRML